MSKEQFSSILKKMKQNGLMKQNNVSFSKIDIRENVEASNQNYRHFNRFSSSNSYSFAESKEYTHRKMKISFLLKVKA